MPLWQPQKQKPRPHARVKPAQQISALGESWRQAALRAAWTPRKWPLPWTARRSQTWLHRCAVRVVRPSAPIEILLADAHWYWHRCLSGLCSPRRFNATYPPRMPSASHSRSTRPRRFLDPLIVVRGEDGRFWTPNGRHRLAAGKVLGLKQITVLISPDETLAYRILALNTEKAHNLRDRSLEVIRMARSLAKRHGGSKESQYTKEFEAAELLTLGIVYEKSSRFAGGAYSSFLKKVDRFGERTLAASLREREGHASRLLEIDARAKKIIETLQARGFKSPYLRNYVVARINPVRFHKAKKGDTKPAMPLAQALTRMAAAAKNFKVESVSNRDLAWVAVGAGAQE